MRSDEDHVVKVDLAVAWVTRSAVPSEQGVITTNRRANSSLLSAKGSMWAKSADATPIKCTDTSYYIRGLIP